MRTTLNIDDSLIARVCEYTGEMEKTAVVRMGLEALLEREAGKRLAALGGSMPDLIVPLSRLYSKRREVVAPQIFVQGKE